MKRFRFILLIAWALLLVILCVGSELGARMWIATHGIQIHNDSPVHPDLLKQSPFWTPELDSEHAHITFRFNPTGYWQINDFQGKYINIVNGIRVTASQPAQYKATVWVFGNSGLANTQLPDAYTIASQLQTILNRSGYALRVVNLGADGQRVSGELAYMRDTPIKQGDIVIFYDGMLEAQAAYDDGRQFPCNFLADKYSTMALVTLLCGERGASIVNFSQADITSYQDIVLRSKDYALSTGATFYHFVQPYIDPRFDNVFDLMATKGSVRIKGISGDLFMETSHLNERGNAIIAGAIYDAIWGTF